MSKLALIYASVHHKNTKKVVDYIAAHFSGDIDVIDITKNKEPDLCEAKWVVFASGIYFSTVHKAIKNYIEGVDLSGKKVIIVYTCGMRYFDYAKTTGKQATRRNAEYIGSSYCRGFDTFGPLRLVGGVAKKHPNEKDCEKIFASVKKLMEEHC